MFGWFKAKMQRETDYWRFSKAHLLMLSKFCQPESVARFQSDPNWTTALGEPPREAIQAMRSAGMLRACELNELLEAKFKGSDLKHMLKAAGQKVSGRKSEQAKRLAEHDEAGARQAVGDFFALCCTNEGERLARDYLAQQETVRTNAEQEAIDKLRDRDFNGAAAVVRAFEADQVFSRGMGINWSKTTMTNEVRQLELVFRDVPAILNGIGEKDLQDLRIAAGMMLLWGSNTAKRWFPGEIPTAGHLSGDAAARMLVFYAHHKDGLKDLKKEGIKSVQIMGANDRNQCEACRALDGKEFSLSKVPELPLGKCTCDLGCRCHYMPRF